jgi:hypothetical protein
MACQQHSANVDIANFMKADADNHTRFQKTMAWAHRSLTTVADVLKSLLSHQQTRAGSAKGWSRLP